MISLAEAQRLLAKAGTFEGDERGRRLLRHLQAREVELGSKLIHYTAAGHARVSMTEIRLRCPELRRSSVDDVVREMREYLAEGARKQREELREALSEFHSAHVDPQFEELYEREEKTAEAVRVLKARVDRLESQNCPKVPTVPAEG